MWSNGRWLGRGRGDDARKRGELLLELPAERVERFRGPRTARPAGRVGTTGRGRSESGVDALEPEKRARDETGADDEDDAEGDLDRRRTPSRSRDRAADPSRRSPATGGDFRTSASGASESRTPQRSAVPAVKSEDARVDRGPPRCGGGSPAARRWSAASVRRATTRPAAAPSAARRSPSARHCRRRRPRPAPRATRSEIPARREAARATRRPATLTQVMPRRIADASEERQQRRAGSPGRRPPAGRRSGIGGPRSRTRGTRSRSPRRSPRPRARP